tara:strand:- start:15675 stop:15878 length:204 start_codon:yes stop_codon:yes gene_type:complete
MRGTLEVVITAVVAFTLTVTVLTLINGCTINTRRQKAGPPVTCYLVAMRCTVDTGAPPPPLTLPTKE